MWRAVVLRTSQAALRVNLCSRAAKAIVTFNFNDEMRRRTGYTVPSTERGVLVFPPRVCDQPCVARIHWLGTPALLKILSVADLKIIGRDQSRRGHWGHSHILALTIATPMIERANLRGAFDAVYVVTQCVEEVGAPCSGLAVHQHVQVTRATKLRGQ